MESYVQCMYNLLIIQVTAKGLSLPFYPLTPTLSQGEREFVGQH